MQTEHDSSSSGSDSMLLAASTLGAPVPESAGTDQRRSTVASAVAEHNSLGWPSASRGVQYTGGLVASAVSWTANWPGCIVAVAPEGIGQVESQAAAARRWPCWSCCMVQIAQRRREMSYRAGMRRHAWARLDVDAQKPSAGQCPVDAARDPVALRRHHGRPGWGSSRPVPRLESHPVQDLPFGSWGGEISQALAAQRARRVRSLGWSGLATNQELNGRWQR